MLYGSTGNGSASHLAAELFNGKAGVSLRHVPFRGAAPMTTELIAGRIDVSFATLPSVIAQIEAGELKALAIASAARAARLPNVPTLAEAGIAGVEADAWFALFAPARTPAAAIEHLHRAVAAALATEAAARGLCRAGHDARAANAGRGRGLAAGRSAEMGDRDQDGRRCGRVGSNEETGAAAMQLTPQQLKAFDDQGFVFLPNCFSEEEIALLRIEGEAILNADRQEVWREKTGAPRTAFAAHTFNEVFRLLVEPSAPRRSAHAVFRRGCLRPSVQAQRQGGVRGRRVAMAPLT